MLRGVSVLVLLGVLFVGLPLPAEQEAASDVEVTIQGVPVSDGRVWTNVRGMPWPETDLLILPRQTPFTGTLSQARPVGQPGFEQGDIVQPDSRVSHMNGLSGFFSSASGGFGFRLGYDRRLSPVLRLIAGTEMLTYGFQQTLEKLGDDLPPGVGRVTLMSLPVGLQRQFTVRQRVVPHVGFGVGPYVRFDHQNGPAGYYPGGFGINTGVGRTGVGSAYGGVNVGVGPPLDGFTQMSLTLGGYAAAGFDVRLGEERALALTIDGRYTLARFTDMLGNPGNLGGFALAIGFGKYF